MTRLLARFQDREEAGPALQAPQARAVWPSFFLLDQGTSGRQPPPGAGHGTILGGAAAEERVSQ